MTTSNTSTDGNNGKAKFHLMEFHFGQEDTNGASPGKLPKVSIDVLRLTNDLGFDFYPKGQRRSEAWNSDKRRLFINALMLGEINLGQIIVHYDSKTGRYFAIDGSHRLSTLQRDFRKGKLLWKGKKWPGALEAPPGIPELSPEEQQRYYNNARFTAVVYTDLKQGEVSHVFSESNDGVPVNEAELYNSTAGTLSDLIRIFTRKYPKDSISPDFCGDIMTWHPLFVNMGEKWQKRHEHEMMAVMFFHEAFSYIVHEKNFYKKGSENNKPNRQRLYFRYDQVNEKALIGHWEKLCESEEGEEIARKVILRAVESMTIMDRCMEVGRDRNNTGLLGNKAKPGKMFWNLFCFIRGLDIDYKNFKITDYETFVDNYIKLDYNLTIRDPENLSRKTVYEQKAGGWTSNDMIERNGVMKREFLAMGDLNDWGVRGGQRARFTLKQRQFQYAAQGGRCAITGKKVPFDKMEAHHTHCPAHLNGPSNVENLEMVSIAAHRRVHAITS
jgi:hypothetical protein